MPIVLCAARNILALWPNADPLTISRDRHTRPESVQSKNMTGLLKVVGPDFIDARSISALAPHALREHRSRRGRSQQPDRPTTNRVQR